jgi:hypothetical protein
LLYSSVASFSNILGSSILIMMLSGLRSAISLFSIADLAAYSFAYQHELYDTQCEGSRVQEVSFGGESLECPEG